MSSFIFLIAPRSNHCYFVRSIWRNLLIHFLYSFSLSFYSILTTLTRICQILTRHNTHAFLSRMPSLSISQFKNCIMNLSIQLNVYIDITCLIGKKKNFVRNSPLMGYFLFFFLPATRFFSQNCL